MNDYKITKILREIKDLNHEDKRELTTMLRANDLVNTLDDIWNDIFRPSMKHGYSDLELNKLIECCGEDGKGYHHAYDVIDNLGQMFLGICHENGVRDLMG